MVERQWDADFIERIRRRITRDMGYDYQVRFLTIQHEGSGLPERIVEIEQEFSWGFFERLGNYWLWSKLRRDWEYLLRSSRSPECWKPEIREVRSWKKRSLIFSFKLRIEAFPEVVIHPHYRSLTRSIEETMYTGRTALAFSEPKQMKQSA